MWKYNNGFMVNEHGKVLDAEGGKDWDGTRMVAWNKNNGKHQQFDIIYVDEYPKEPKKGELNEKFGLYVERPFHIVSAMPARRYLDIIGYDLAIKTPNGQPNQMWWFDQKTLTIKNKKHSSYSVHIDGNGKSQKMKVTSTTSKWW